VGVGAGHGGARRARIGVPSGSLPGPPPRAHGLSRDSPPRRPAGLRSPRSRRTAAPAARPALGSCSCRAPPPLPLLLHCCFPLPVPAPPRSPSPALRARRGREPRAASAAGPAAGPAHLQRRAGPAARTHRAGGGRGGAGPSPTRLLYTLTLVHTRDPTLHPPWHTHTHTHTHHEYMAHELTPLMPSTSKYLHSQAPATTTTHTYLQLCTKYKP
jgi:hypothetical protein